MHAESATPKHALSMLGRFRQADMDELMDGYGMSPMSAILYSLNVSPKTWALLHNGRVVAVGGVANSDRPGTGYPWMITSTDMDVPEIGRAFLHMSRPILRTMLELFPRLENYVDSRNTKAIAWLKWLGFEIHEAKPYGMFGAMFHHFEMGG